MNLSSPGSNNAHEPVFSKHGNRENCTDVLLLVQLRRRQAKRRVPQEIGHMDCPPLQRSQSRWILACGREAPALEKSGKLRCGTLVSHRREAFTIVKKQSRDVCLAQSRRVDEDRLKDGLQVSG